MKDYIYTIFQESGSLSTEENFPAYPCSINFGLRHLLILLFYACRRRLFQKIQRLTYHPDDSYGNGYDSYRQ